MRWFPVLLFIGAVLLENGFTMIPDFIHPCNLNNATCLLKSTQDAIPGFSKGVPELAVPPMDPFYIENISVSFPGVKISFSKCKVTGFRKSMVDEVYYKNDKLTFVMRANVTLKGQYELDGRVLTFPVQGKGDAKIKMSNLKVTFKVKTSIVPDDKGVEHFTASNYKFNYEYGDKITYDLTNLFDGNQELSNTVLTFMNDNWRLVAEEFGKPLIDYSVELAVAAIEKFFLAVPYQELIVGPVPSK